MSEGLTRRPIAARSSSWAHKIAAQLARRKVQPNTISVLIVFFAAPIFFHFTRYYFIPDA